MSLSPVPGTSLALEVQKDSSFKVLEGAVSEETLKGIHDMGFTHMTEIQQKSIPYLLEGRLVFCWMTISFHDFFTFFIIAYQNVICPKAILNLGIKKGAGEGTL